jgi:hypothetical protein
MDCNEAELVDTQIDLCNMNRGCRCCLLELDPIILSCEIFEIYRAKFTLTCKETCYFSTSFVVKLSSREVAMGDRPVPLSQA